MDRLSRAGLAAELDRQPDLTVVGKVSGDEHSFLSLDIYGPDVIVWDVSWETASAARNLERLPKNPPPVLALAATGQQAAQAQSAGAQAFLNRSATPEALAAVLASLSHGLQVTDPSLVRDSGAAAPETGVPSHLTPRENDVLRLLAERGCPIKAWPLA